MKGKMDKYNFRDLYEKGNLKAIGIMIFSFLLLKSIYFTLNNSSNQVYSLAIRLDKIIPFIKIFIIPYVIWCPFIILTLIYLCFKDKKAYYITLISIIISVIICFMIYFLFQTTVTRPEICGKDFLSQTIKIIYSTDKPFNCFPSIHALTSFLMIKGILKSRKRNPVSISIIGIIAISIIMSTLFVKQHVVLDVGVAILIGNTIFNIIGKISASTLSKT